VGGIHLSSVPVALSISRRVLFLLLALLRLLGALSGEFDTGVGLGFAPVLGLLPFIYLLWCQFRRDQ
jgi:hypothetical protein